MPLTKPSRLKGEGGTFAVVRTAAMCALAFSSCALGPEDGQQSSALLELESVHAADVGVDGGSSPARGPAALDGGRLAPSAPRTEGDAGNAEKESNPEVRIEWVTALSRECPARPTIASDGRSVTLQFDSAGLAGDRGLVYLYCPVEASIRVPPGFSFTLEGVSGSGRVSLPAGVSAQFQTRPSFGRSFDGELEAAAAVFTGPLDGPVTFVHEFPRLGFSCRSAESVVLHTYVVLTNSSEQPARVSLTSLEIARLAVKPCDGT